MVHLTDLSDRALLPLHSLESTKKLSAVCPARDKPPRRDFSVNFHVFKISPLFFKMQVGLPRYLPVLDFAHALHTRPVIVIAAGAPPTHFQKQLGLWTYVALFYNKSNKSSA